MTTNSPLPRKLTRAPFILVGDALAKAMREVPALRHLADSVNQPAE
jgi:hypothetical protein